MRASGWLSGRSGLGLSDPMGQESLPGRSDGSGAAEAAGAVGPASGALEERHRFPWNRICGVDGVALPEGVLNRSSESEQEVAGRPMAAADIGLSGAVAESRSGPSGELPGGADAGGSARAAAVTREHEPPRRPWFIESRGVPVGAPGCGEATPRALHTLSIPGTRGGATYVVDAQRGDSASWASAEDGGRAVCRASQSGRSWTAGGDLASRV